jgi:hypothetical protein
MSVPTVVATKSCDKVEIQYVERVKSDLLNILRRCRVGHSW